MHGELLVFVGALMGRLSDGRRRLVIGSVARSRLCPDLSDVDRFVALAAHHDGVHVVVARRVMQYERRAVGPAEPPVTPRCHRRKDRIHLASLLGQSVLRSGRMALILDALHDPLVDELVEAPREDVATDAELTLEVVEPSGAETRLTDQQQIPVITQHCRAARDRARPVGGIHTLHVDEHRSIRSMTERKSVRRQSGGLQPIAALEDTEIEFQRSIADTWRPFQIVL